MSKKLKKILILLGILIILGLIYISDIRIPCLFKLITGLHCPGCGITRCLEHLIKLEFYASFRSNPLVFILLPFLTYYLIYKIYIWIMDKKDNITSNIKGWPIYLLIVVVLLFGILRNTSMFSFLQPLT